MAKYSYHHHHPKLSESINLHNGGHNQSWNFYNHEQAAKIVKSSHFLKRFSLGRKISLVCVAAGDPR